ncbi:CBS domain-containing protein [Olleya aquimaris]|uniref:CBS domain-containing protein n=1 Tax=Olleya sediminilitoris TaxID=2795739 RepID=A0ABS1WP17_9FLAO|nr:MULTISPECIES: CBS domain-containing protein [Olleya]AXO80319.1 CBS domain-containing protein [Olleya aquimaris]MBL7560871.1 CBS domain-containing protein [Olleya sediminilitoris]
MNLSDYIINDIKPLLNTSVVSDLQLLFNQLTYSHIPIKNEADVYLGCVSENDAHCFQKVQVISDCSYAIEGFFVREEANWLDVLEAFAQNATNIMPVLNERNKYLGYYELNDIIGLFNETPFFSENGAILIVEKGLQDYSFSEVSQIVESNDGKLYGAFISKIENDVAQITLKIGNVGLSEVMQTFRRYSYNIVSGHEEDSYLDGLKERSDYLNKYLDM